MIINDRSFYVLDVCVRPGGSREAWVFVSSQIEEIKTALNYALDVPDAIYLTVWYGREVYLRTYQNGDQTQKINLLPFIEIRISGFPLISFDETGQLCGINFPDRYNYGDETADFEIDTDDFIDLVLSEDFEFSFDVDWDKVPFEQLTGSLAMPGEKVLIKNDYGLDKTLEVRYGYTDFEDWLYRAPDFEWEEEDFY